MAESIDFRRLAGPIENDYVKEWKAAGGRVIGFFCSHAPEELLWAAGLLPIRMRGTGSEDTAHADQYLGAVNCSFVRHTLNRVITGDLAVLDGLLITNSCDHVRRLFDVCSVTQPRLFCHYLDVPHLNTESAEARLVGQLRALKERLEASFSVGIRNEKLREALRLYNRTRRLLDRASQLRGQDPPRATGSELLAMAVAAASMPKTRFNPMLEQRLGELERGSPDAARSGPRLMVIGGMLDDLGFLEVIESLGASIVADQLCCGSKTFSIVADETIDPIEAIARRMLGHLPCPRMVGAYESRLSGVRETAERYRVDGIICQRLKFCDLWAGEIDMLRRSLKEEPRIPLLVLERDYLTAGGLGQLRTRVQAFLEGLA